ncbi:MAG: ring-1,2-phenylacetyl-CoA epoxidase subunit PaaD [Flavobacteriaceae bacterium]|jgi:ring-1,2-phenylacetyl-CoA epoxidase subunit PaaD
MVTVEEVWNYLDQVFDPEVPVLTIRDLGIVRDVIVTDHLVNVVITPTYTGCPAMSRIEDDIKEVLLNHGIENCKVDMVLSPAWTTDWLSENGKKKLEEYGIAPPVDETDKSVLFSEPDVIPCPRCKSKNTRLISQFGSTACKAHHQCKDCLEPFDYFKCLK